MNSFNIIHKQAVAPAAAAAGASAISGKAIYGFIKDVLGLGKEIAKPIIEKAPGLVAATAAVTGLTGGYGLARLTEPTAVSENSDKILEREALATEIAVTARRLKALQERRKALKHRATAEQRYDRFV